jgi:hypothetical protein
VTLGSHQTSVGRSQVHCTPRWILERLGPFDLDPCAADPRPWDCAAENWTSDGLGTPWHGRVWLNPPFDRYEVGRWIARLAQHGNGTALLHARTEAGWFQPIWEFSTAILFMADRIKFADRTDPNNPPIVAPRRCWWHSVTPMLRSSSRAASPARWLLDGIGNRAHVRNSGVTPMHDRAATVAPAVMRLLIDTMHKEFSPTEFYQQLVQLLSDEFADERRQTMADRELSDA